MDTLAGRGLALVSMGSFTRAIYSKKNWHMLFITNKASNIKVSVKENEVPTEKILVARVFSLQRKVIYQIKAKRLNYPIKDFISSNFKRRLNFLLSNSEVSSLLLKLQPFRVVKYSLPFYCI